MPTANRVAKERMRKYNTSLGKRICQLIAEGYSLNKICSDAIIKKEHKIPIARSSVIRNWIRDIPEFKTMIEQAYRDRADYVLDQYHETMAKLEDGELDQRTADTLLKAQQYLLDKMHPMIQEANQKAAPLQIANQGGAIQIVLAPQKEKTDALRLETQERQKEGKGQGQRVLEAEVVDA